MYGVEARLTHWKSLYDELGAAQLAWREACEGHAAGSASAAQLEARMHSLQRRSDEALQALNAALAACHGRGDGVHPA